MSDDRAEPGGGHIDVPTRSSRVIDFNILKVRLLSNLSEFSAYSYFTRFATDESEADYELRCVDLDRDELDESALAAATDTTTRAKRFRTGYYRGPYFGPPAYLATRGRTWSVFGRSLDRIVWPYLVKQVLNTFSMDTGYLHLKAGAFVLPDGGATLLVGQGGGGKTVFLTQACRDGARFLTNTHALLSGGTVHAVPSAIRVRDDECFRELIRASRLESHLAGGEYLADPEVLFGGDSVRSAEVRNIVVVNYRAGQQPRFERISTDTAMLFLEQFAFGVTAYDLKNDLFDYVGHDLERYATGYGAMKDALSTLCRNTRCYVANVRMQDPQVRSSVLDELAEPQFALL